MATEFKLSYTAQDINNRLGKIDSFAEKSEIPSKTSELANDSVFITGRIAQSLTEEQKTQARANIGAATIEEVEDLLVQSDWNQTDETAADFIKNKTHYQHEECVEIVPETEMTGIEDSGAYCVGLTAYPFTGTEERVAITYDGVRYDCVADMSQGMPIFGNMSIGGMGADTGEPFLLMIAPAYGFVMLALLDGNAHTVSISELRSLAKKIDPIYLPSVAILHFDDDKYLYPTSDTSDTSKRLTLADLMSIVKSAVPIYVYYNGNHAAVTHVIDVTSFGLVQTLSNMTASYNKYYTAEYIPETTT